VLKAHRFIPHPGAYDTASQAIQAFSGHEHIVSRCTRSIKKPSNVISRGPKQPESRLLKRMVANRNRLIISGLLKLISV